MLRLIPIVTGLLCPAALVAQSDAVPTHRPVEIDDSRPIVGVCGHYVLLGAAKTLDAGFARQKALETTPGEIGVIPHEDVPRFEGDGYSLILGPFATRAEAEARRDDWLGRVPDAYVKRGCSEAEAAAAGRSRYTTLDLDACRLLDADAEGLGWMKRCPGDGGVPLYVNLGDGRFDVDVGQPDTDFILATPFNDLGDTVEWRYGADGALRAVIVRYDFDMGGSDLAVIRAPRGDAVSCYVAFVTGDAAPSQNEAARVIADSADSRACIDRR